jgi:hypothetical protein
MPGSQTGQECRAWVDYTLEIAATSDALMAELVDIDVSASWLPGLTAVERRSAPLAPGQKQLQRRGEMRMLRLFDTFSTHVRAGDLGQARHASTGAY